MRHKSRITLAVDKEALKKAKNLGINLSHTMDLALKGFSFSSTGNDQKALIEAYDSLFKAMSPLLRQFGASFMVANTDLYDPADPDNKAKQERREWYVSAVPVSAEDEAKPGWLDNYYLCEDDEGSRPVTVEQFFKEGITDVFPPNDILSSFVESLAEAAEQNRQHLKEIAMAKRIVAAIKEEVTAQPQTRRAKSTAGHA